MNDQNTISVTPQHRKESSNDNEKYSRVSTFAIRAGISLACVESFRNNQRCQVVITLKKFPTKQQKRYFSFFFSKICRTWRMYFDRVIISRIYRCQIQINVSYQSLYFTFRKIVLTRGEILRLLFLITSFKSHHNTYHQPIRMLDLLRSLQVVIYLSMNLKLRQI